MNNSSSMGHSQLLKLIDRLPGTIFQYQQWPDGRCTFPYSQAAIEGIFFTSPAKLASDGNWAWKCLSPESAKEFRSKLESSVDTMKEFETVLQTRSPQGRLHWIRTHIIPEHQEDGSTLWYGRLENITKEYEDAEIAKRNHALLNVLFENLPDHIYYKDSDSKILRANPAFYRFHGLTEADLIHGKTDIDFYAEKDAKTRLEAEQELIRNGEVVTSQEKLISKAGNVHHFESFKCPLKDPSGAVIGLVDISRDITNHIESEKNLLKAKQEAEKSAALINAIFETLPDQIYYKDKQTRILGANAACYTHHGYSSAEPMLGKNAQELYPVRIGQQIYNKDVSVMISGTPLRERECYEREDKSVVFLESFKSPLKNKAGESIGLVGISRDITDQVQREKDFISARKDAIEASKAKSSFLAMMSHEIRTPMNGVIGAASLLMGTRLDSEQEEFVHTIQISGDNLLTIINDILDYSKIEAGKIELESVPFYPRECVEDAFDLFVQQAAQKNLELICDISPDVPECLKGDPTRLRQVIVNLLGNAVKFTQEGEISVHVNVSTEDLTEKCQLLFSVRDTGIGISEEAQTRLFQSFTQADASSTRKYGGTGLGLTISQRLTKLMGGKIWINSKEDEGSTFSFTASFPIAQCPKKNEESYAIELRGKHALVVDDNQTNRKILTAQLKQWGITANAFAHPEQVIQHLKEAAPYDIALLDYQMPGINGETLANEIYHLPDLPALPVIILSSSYEDVRPQPAISARMTKPIKMNKLRQQMLHLMSKHSLQKEASAQAGPHILPKKNKQLSIMVAEDNSVNQRVIQMMLQRLGYQNCVFVGNGLEAVAAAMDKEYDVILMDIQMPEMNGLDATRKIRENAESTTQPWIIALTAGVTEEERKQIDQAEMNGFLAKPLAIDQLESTLNQLDLD